MPPNIQPTTSSVASNDQPSTSPYVTNLQPTALSFDALNTQQTMSPKRAKSRKTRIELTTSEAYKVLCNINPNKASGPDNLYWVEYLRRSQPKSHHLSVSCSIFH